MLSPSGLEVFLLDPGMRLVWVSSFCPLPQCQKDRMIHLVEGFRADHMSVIISPTSNFGVELSNEIACCGLFVLLHDFADPLQKSMDVLFRGLNQQFSVVFPDMLSEKVKAVLNVRDEGFLLGDFDPLLGGRRREI